MLQHPILINRPIVVTPLGTKLCRPSEVVLDILPDAQKGLSPRKMARKSLMMQAKIEIKRQESRLLFRRLLYQIKQWIASI